MSTALKLANSPRAKQQPELVEWLPRDLLSLMPLMFAEPYYQLLKELPEECNIQLLSDKLLAVTNVSKELKPSFNTLKLLVAEALFAEDNFNLPVNVLADSDSLNASLNENGAATTLQSLYEPTKRDALILSFIHKQTLLSKQLRVQLNLINSNIIAENQVSKLELHSSSDRKLLDQSLPTIKYWMHVKSNSYLSFLECACLIDWVNTHKDEHEKGLPYLNLVPTLITAYRELIKLIYSSDDDLDTSISDGILEKLNF